ncbi:hypothetical protein JL721_1569 [Aureococcus anophagefferens]|nr:hypothetical protein JL721_1569 [Aureococcus anophagefferens]
MSAFQPAAGANTSRPAGSNSPRPGVRPRGDERDGDGAGGSTTVSLHWTPALLASTTENATFTESEESVVDQLMRELALSNDVVSRRLRVLDRAARSSLIGARESEDDTDKENDVPGTTKRSRSTATPPAPAPRAAALEPRRRSRCARAAPAPGGDAADRAAGRAGRARPLPVGAAPPARGGRSRAGAGAPPGRAPRAAARLAEVRLECVLALDDDGGDDYPSPDELPAWFARVVVWVERRCGLTGETKFILRPDSPTKDFKVTTGTFVAVYDPRGCVLVERFAAEKGRTLSIPVRVGDVAERDRLRTLSLDVAGSLETYVAPNDGGRTVVPRSLAFHREVSLHHVGGLLASDQSTSFTMHRNGRSYEFHCDLRQLRSSGSVAMAARLAEMIGGTRAVLLTQCASGLGKDYDGRECQLVMVGIPSSLEWIRLIAPYMWPKQEFTLILRAVDEAGLFRGKGGSSKEETDAWVNARVKLVEACAKVKTEAGQQTHAELRAWRPYLDARGRIVRDDLAKTFGGFLDGDASAKADLSFSIAQSYEAFLDVISEDLNATFGTTFSVYPMPHTKVSVKQPFRALSYNRTGNRALARAVLRTGFPTCSEKYPALRAIANSSP